MTQDEITENNVLVSAIYPLKNILMCDGGEADELANNIIESEPLLVEGLADFIEAGWKSYGITDDEGGPVENFGDIERWQRSELLSEWAFRHVPASLLIASVAAPVPRFRKESSGYSFSWGCTFTGYVSGSTIEELYQAAAAWKESRYEAEKAKA